MSSIVLDTNILVSALLFKQSIPRQVFDKTIDRGKILFSTTTFDELDLVLQRDKFSKYITSSERKLFLQMLSNKSNILDVQEIVTACRDPKDNKFLDLAMAGKANYIITGDQDLLVLHPFNHIEIITPRYFLENFS